MLTSPPNHSDQGVIASDAASGHSASCILHAAAQPAFPAVLQTAGLLILSRNVRHRLPFGRLFAVVEPQQ